MQIVCWIQKILIWTGTPTATTTTQPITLGNYPGDDARYQGELDEVRIWNLAKTQEQIIADASVTLNAGPGLVASYDFNQGVPGSDNSGLTNLPDISGNGNDGALSLVLSLYQKLPLTG